MEIIWTQLLSQVVMFAVFVWFCARFIWPPLVRAIENRQKQVAEGLAAAEKGRQSLETSARQAEQTIAEARSRASEIIAQADRRATQMIEDARNEAKEEGNREKAAAKAEIEQEYARAREQLREHVAALALAGAEKILRREVDAKTHSDLLATIEQQV
jgi:F-type H+-transporting ATPase subunit b